MVYRFTDVVIDSRTGLNPRKNFVLGGGDNYYITIKDIYNGKVNLTDKTDKVDDEAIQIIKRRSRIKAGDVLFVSIGRIGETAIVTNKDDSWDVNESVFVFTLNDKIITPEYFCTMFQSQGVKQYLSGNSSGSTFKSIKMNQLERMTFDLPPVTTQKSITTKLTAVRRIIDLRTSQLAELNNLVKARFVELFGSLNNNKKGFDIVSIEELCTLIKDGTHQTPIYTEDKQNGFKFLSSKDVMAQKICWDDIKYIPAELHEKLYATIQPQRNDILMSKNGVNYGVAAVNDTDEIFDIYVSLALLRPKTNMINPVYLRCVINNPDTKRQFDSSIKGIGVPNLHLGEIKKTKVLLPPIDKQNEFVAFVEQLDKSKVVVQKALDEAQTLFDSLMQEYFR